MNLGENIYRFRTEKNMSQGDLADALNVSRQSVSKWENNSATPELEKLIRMSELFGISLDELVGRAVAEPETPSPEAVQAPPAQQVIIRNEFRPVSIRQIIGVILICTGLVFLPLALSATYYKATVSCLILLGAFALCGISILVFPYPYIPCGWTLLAAFTLYIFLLFRWEAAYLELALIGFALVCMIWWTVHAHQKGIITIPKWLWWVGGLVLAILLILFWMNFVPPVWISVSEHAVTKK